MSQKGGVFAPVNAFISLTPTECMDSAVSTHVYIRHGGESSQYGNEHGTGQLQGKVVWSQPPDMIIMNVSGIVRFIDTPDDIKIVLNAVTLGDRLITCAPGHKCGQCLACCAVPGALRKYKVKNGVIKFITITADTDLVEVSQDADSEEVMYLHKTPKRVEFAVQYQPWTAGHDFK